MQRPVILLGNGVRGNPALLIHLRGLGIPVLTTWPGCDLMNEGDTAFCGRPGILGQRAANIIIQKSTHLYVFGARLDEGTTGFRGYDGFAPNARKYIHEIDLAELAKLPDDWWGVAENIVDAMGDSPDWLSWCKRLYDRLRPELDGQPAKPGYIDPHAFIRELSTIFVPGDICVAGAGQAGEVTLQAVRVRGGVRVLTLANNGAMGYDIPISIGAAVTGRRVLCVTGEGGFQLNIHDLETARREKLDITFFVMNNGGYGSIRNMQNVRFSGRHVACDAASGFTTPSLRNIARCYGLPFYLLSKAEEVRDLPHEHGPRIVEVPVDPEWVHLPRVMSTLKDGKWYPDSLEDMTPRLPDLAQIMEE